MIKMWMAGIFYPSRCPFCQKVMVGGKLEICDSCRKKIKKISEPQCKRCGRPIRSKEQEFCPDCQRKRHLYREGMAIYLYKEEVRKAVHRMKFQNQRAYAQIFGRLMAKEAEEKTKRWKVEAVVPVPMYRKKQRLRGYNQAELLAREIADELNLPLICDLVARVRNTKPQKELEGKDRENNLKKAFIITKNDVKLRKILIVDDIYTTGSTVDAIAEVLKKSGVEEIYFLSLCIGGSEEGEST
ncbi:MAG: ComF family protein [Eubacteriales bacterium]|nr:ComF family protein [Eubacteriales bacterium]